MEKPFPCQEKVSFLVKKGARILKNPLRWTIFSMNLNRDSKAYGILHFESGSTDEPVLGADEGMEKIARFHHFLVALVVSLGDVEPGPDVFKVGSKNNDIHPS
jgi:hypothetical protein